MKTALGIICGVGSFLLGAFVAINGVITVIGLENPGFADFAKHRSTKFLTSGLFNNFGC